MLSGVVDASRDFPDALTTLEASEQMRATCHAGWVANWLSVEHSHQLTSVGKLVVPGLLDSDLLFAAYLIVVLRRAESALEVRLDGDTIFAPGAQAPDDTSTHHRYVDDCVDITAQTHCALAVLTDVFNRYGFTLHFSPGETDVLLDIRGMGARKIRAEVFSRKDTKLDFFRGRVRPKCRGVPHM